MLIHRPPILNKTAPCYDKVIEISGSGLIVDWFHVNDGYTFKELAETPTQKKIHLSIAEIKLLCPVLGDAYANAHIEEKRKRENIYYAWKYCASSLYRFATKEEAKRAGEVNPRWVDDFIFYDMHNVTLREILQNKEEIVLYSYYFQYIAEQKYVNHGQGKFTFTFDEIESVYPGYIKYVNIGMSVGLPEQQAGANAIKVIKGQKENNFDSNLALPLSLSSSC